MMLKKFLVYFLIISLLLPALPIQAEGIYKMVGSGSITQPNMKISAVDGTAFIDFSDSEAAANKLINHKGYLLKIRDSSKRAIQGYIKAAGTGETLDDELISDPGWEGTYTDGLCAGRTLYSTPTIAQSADVHGGSKAQSFTANAGVQLIINANIITSAYELRKFTSWNKRSAGSSGNVFMQFYDAISEKNSAGITSADYAQTTIYMTAKTTLSSLRIRQDAGTGFDTILTDDWSLKKVLTPSATGVTIVSAKGGSTFNFAAKDSAFNYNDSSGYTYELWQVNNAVEVASGSIAANLAQLDTTDTNAFAGMSGVNLSAYQDGKHILALYNTSGGYAAFGYIKGTAPGGETLGAELLSNWTNSELYLFEVFASTGGNNVSGENTSGAAIASNSLQNSIGGMLIKLTADHVLTSGAMTRLFGTQPIVGEALPLVVYAENPSTGAIATYATEESGNRYLQIYAAAAVVFAETNISWKQVIDCAVTGALIVNAKDGSTRSWAYKHASFDPNAASTYKVFYVGD